MAEPTTTEATPVEPADRRHSARLRAALLSYRVAAWVVGTGLVVLVFVGMPMKYLGHNDSVVQVVGFLHGMLFIVYCLIVVTLAGLARWSLKRTAGVALAGTIPLLGFFVERWVSHRTDVRQ